MKGNTLYRQESLLDAPIIGTLPTIMVVEDDDNILDFLIDLLTDEHFHVLWARSGEGALQLLSTYVARPQLLLLDYMLGPGMDGIALYDLLCTRFGCCIPTLMLSAALPEREVVQRSIIGVHKPFDLDALLTLIEKSIHEATGTVSAFSPY